MLFLMKQVKNKKTGVKELLKSDATPKKEIALIRLRGSKWSELPTERRTVGGVVIGAKGLHIATKGREFSFLHTHPRLERDTMVSNPRQILDDSELDSFRQDPEYPLDEREEAMRYSPSFPSSLDIRFLLEFENNRTFITAQRDPITGEVAGYFFVQ